MGIWRKSSNKKIIKRDHIITSDYLKEDIENFFRVKTKGIWVQQLAGDASDRNFYRIIFQKKGTYASREHFVLMVLNDAKAGDDLPYVNVQQFLKSRRIPVPEIYHIDMKKGFLFLEDLGDVTYERRVKSVTRTEQESYYRWAIDLLVQMQFECSDPGKQECIAHKQSFDKNKYMYEFEFFMKHLLEQHLKKTVDSGSREIMMRDFSFISDTLVAEEKCFNHRDYHSRNIMIKEGRLVLVDFQDARMGCFQYDLASLLRDSYVSLDNNMISNMIDYYLRKWNELGMKGIDRYQFRKIFDYASLQRNIKATGTFGYMVAVKKQKRYEQYLAPTFYSIRLNLEKYREFRELKETLSRYIEDLV